MATNYPYTTGIPVSTNTPAQDQPGMQINCTSISQIIGTDHLTFGSAMNALTDGMHTVIHLADNGGNRPATVAGTGMLYANSVTFNGNTDEALFFRPATGGGGNIFQMTAPFGYNQSFNGYTFLPGGTIMQWGFVNGSHGGSHTFNPGDSGTVTFPIAFPNQIFNVTTNVNYNSNTAGTPSSTSAMIVALNYFATTTTGFGWQTAGSGGSYTVFYWMAIGN